MYATARTRASWNGATALALAGLVVTTASAQPGGEPPALFTVGDDFGCTHSTLAAALDAAASLGPGTDLVRVSRNYTAGLVPVAVRDHSVIIAGGFEDCRDSSADGFRTTIPGRSASVIAIENSGDRRGVVLRDLSLDGGSATLGGGIRIEGAVDVRLENTIVSMNRADSGGGIYIDGTDSAGLTIADRSLVRVNEAVFDGGGIACVGAGRIDLLSGDVSFNKGGDGGGIHLAGCTLAVTPTDERAEIALNEAGDGGGIFLEGGEVLLVGSETQPARLQENRAISGVGIFVRDGTVRAENAVFEDNGSGSAIFTNGGSVVVDRTLGASCHDPDRCSWLVGNTPSALEVQGGTVEVRRTVIEGSTGPHAIEIFDDGRLHMEGSVIANNPGQDELIRLGGPALLSLHHMTISDNDRPGTILAVASLEEPAPFFELLSSIVSNSGEIFHRLDESGGEDVEFFVDCLLLEGAINPPIPFRAVETGNPRFVDRVAGNYRLATDSPALDACDAARLASDPADDLDLLPRGVDLGAVPNAFAGSRWDLGAYETQSVPEPAGAWPALAGMALLAWRLRTRLRPRPVPRSRSDRH